MKKMWILLKADCDPKRIKQDLEEIGRVQPDPEDPNRLILTFRNQSETAVKMACFKLSEDFIQYFEDFDMIHQ